MTHTAYKTSTHNVTCVRFAGMTSQLKSTSLVARQLNADIHNGVPHTLIDARVLLPQVVQKIRGECACTSTEPE